MRILTEHPETFVPGNTVNSRPLPDWVCWVLAGWFVYPLGTLFALAFSLPVFLLADIPRLYGRDVYPLPDQARLLAFAMVGAGIGLAVGFLQKRLIKGASGVWLDRWNLYSAAGGFIGGWTEVISFSHLEPGILPALRQAADPAQVEFFVSLLQVPMLQFVLCLSFVQALLLRRYTHRAWLWALSHVIGGLAFVWLVAHAFGEMSVWSWLLASAVQALIACFTMRALLVSRAPVRKRKRAPSSAHDAG